MSLKPFITFKIFSALPFISGDNTKGQQLDNSADFGSIIITLEPNLSAPCFNVGKMKVDMMPVVLPLRLRPHIKADELRTLL